MTQDELDTMCRVFVDQGKLIEVGFLTLRFVVMAPDAPEDQVDEMRMAFFAGAQHLFGSIMGMLEPGAEATPKDVERIVLIGRELDQFIRQFKAAHRRGMN
jgi:hypothetical protein